MNADNLDRILQKMMEDSIAGTTSPTGAGAYVLAGLAISLRLKELTEAINKLSSG